MDSFWAKYSVATPPPITPGGAVGYPGDGDVGVSGTIAGAYWFYQVTTEILNVIVAGGLTVNAGVLNQLQTAIVNMIVARIYNWGANENLVTNGVRRGPNNDMEEWGQQAYTMSANPFSFTITFPTPFTSLPNIPICTVFDNTSPGAGNYLMLSVQAVTTTTFTASVTPNGGSATRAFQVSWRTRGIG